MSDSVSEPFKFKIKRPRRLIDSAREEQIFHIYAEYPHYMYSVILKPEEKMASLDQHRLAIAELKLRLIQEISNAEFEVDVNP